jgi:predicted HTH domain antitoxin
LLREAGLTEADALIELASRLFETGRLTLASAARLARLDRNAMEDALLDRRIPIFNPTGKELISDLESLDRPGH